MTTTTGITFDRATSGSALYFSGTLANLNAALATLTYTRSGTGTDTLEVSLVNRGEVFFEETTKFGPATKAALMQYQKAMKINPSIGYFGSVTRASMK